MARAVGADEELVLLLAGSAGRRAEAAGRMHELATKVTPVDLDRQMVRHRSELVLGARAADLGLLGPGSEALLQRREQHAASRSLLFEGLTEQLLDALERGGAPALALKGAPLAMLAHGAPWKRTSTDIDVLVPREHFARAMRTLGELGYRPNERAGRSALHETLVAAETWKPRVELHWRVHWFGDAFVRRMLDESGIGPSGRREAAPEATLVSLLLFYARDGFTGLRLPIDLAAYTDRVAFSVELVFDHLEEDPEIVPAVSAAMEVVRKLVGVDLGARGPTDRFGRVATRLANWPLRGEEQQIRATMRLVDLMVAPPAKRPSFVRQRLSPFSSPSSNAAYALKTALRWLPAGASVAGGRTAHPLPDAR